MKERFGLITLKGQPITLTGNTVQEGDAAPDFQVVDNDLKPFSFSSLKDKVAIITSVPSLDTPVCDLEARRFNQEAAKLGDDVQILVISMDLPFAQKRWCAAAGVNNVLTLSDHKDASFGTEYGVLIKELRLLARAVFVVDRQKIVRYMELVKEVGQEPNYELALDAAKKLL
ncbi:thiol peroxidase [Desulfonatronum lacustre]|uniref:thiol peroxidase n=1 Tax=Desulfonatronum lacustre TaxID=66849 RepID=UPI00048D34F9|nr:thiol peroxidase [Desulfonatronum lacustre]SMP72789.1 thiol peroxidase (atypical 2-Cys peroxiredoxin) [Desulfonatronum zhilinae]